MLTTVLNSNADTLTVSAIITTAKRTQTWEPTKIPNLFRLKETGTYYGRVKPKGRNQIRKSLETTSFAVAREKLRDWLLSLNIVKRAENGTWGGVIELYMAWLQGQKIRGDIKDSTIEYRKGLIDQIRLTWPGWNAFKLENLTAKIMRDWQVKQRVKFCATRTNGATAVLREMAAIAV